MIETREFTSRGVALAAAALLALPATSLAQGMGMSGHHQTATGQQSSMGPGYGMMGGGMMGGTGMMMGPTPGFILAQRDALGLTDQQTARLDSLQAQMRERWQAHYATMQGIHQQMADLQQAEKPDLGRYQKFMQQMASSSVDMHVQLARQGQEAFQVLTPEQRSKVRYGMQLMGRSGVMGGTPTAGMMGMMGGGVMGGSMRRPDGMGGMGPGNMTGPGNMSYGATCGASTPAPSR